MNKIAERKNWKDLIYLIKRFIAPYWKQSLFLIVLSTIAAACTGLQSLMIAPALDSALKSQAAAPAHGLLDITLNNIGPTILTWLGFSHAGGVGLILIIAGLYILCAFVAAIFTFSSYLLSAWIGAAAFKDLQVAMHKHLLSLSMGFFVRQKTGEVVSRIINDGGETITSLDLSVRQMVLSGVQILFYATLLFKTAPGLTLVTLVVSMLHFVITRVLRDKVRTRTSDKFDALADVGSVMQEFMLSIRVIKSFAAELFEQLRFSASAESLRRLQFKFSIYKHAEEPLRLIADSIAVGMVLFLAFITMQKGGLTVSGFMMYVFLARQVITPTSVFAQSVIRLQGGLGSARRVLEILENKPGVKDGTLDTPAFSRAIELEHVSFAYQQGTPVLSDINLQIRKGQIVAVVGPSGAGKSTMADMVLRLYDPDAGTVRYDGIDVRKFKQSGYRSKFGVVSQECLLFNASIRDNIVYGRPVHSQAQIADAARIANADEFIASLPGGYDTIVGDRGIRLSGGQRQRIAIARAMYARPEILIFDEATSSLDTESERQVQAAIDQMLKNSTAFVIAHRLSTIINSSLIVVLNDGKIEAAGSHSELLTSSPTYKRLYELQFYTAEKKEE